MITDKGSKRKPQFETNRSPENHGYKKTNVWLEHITTSKKTRDDRKKLRLIEIGARKVAPLKPSKRPKRLVDKKLRNGKANKVKYIIRKNNKNI